MIAPITATTMLSMLMPVTSANFRTVPARYPPTTTNKLLANLGRHRTRPVAPGERPDDDDLRMGYGAREHREARVTDSAQDAGCHVLRPVELLEQPRYRNQSRCQRHHFGIT